MGKELWQHILSCQAQNCQYPRCSSSKDLLKHHQKVRQWWLCPAGWMCVKYARDDTSGVLLCCAGGGLRQARCWLVGRRATARLLAQPTCRA